MSHPESGRPYQPVELPPDLAEFLKDQETACLPLATDLGTALVLKLASGDIESVRGTIPIVVRHELYPHPAAPVLRLSFTFLDDPEQPLTIGSYVNIDEPEQLGTALALLDQEAIPMFFYDEALAHTLTKVMPYSGQEDLAYLLEMAQGLWLQIPRDEYDFDAAKAALEARLAKGSQY
jgi:hypothetical protein